VADGFFPQYTEQKRKILFIGRESVQIGSCYIDVLYKAYKEGLVGGKALDQYLFHSRLLKIAYGFTHECCPWTEIPEASEIAATFAEPGGLSFALMNFCKLSNETGGSALDRQAVAAFLEISRAAGKQFFNREINVIQPDLIITMNFEDNWLYSLGTLADLKKVKGVDGYLLAVGDRQIPLLNSFHFSAWNKTDPDDFYDPLVEAFLLYRDVSCSSASGENITR
jgi:hypothetical protein